VAERTTSVLSGKRIVITRPVQLTHSIADALRSHGADPVLLPVVRIEPPLDFHQLDDALHELQQEKFEWIIFGSQNAVHAVMDRAATLGLNLREVFPSLQVAAVGKATAAAAEEVGFRVSRVGRGTGADLITELAPQMHAKHIFLPRSDRAGAAHFAQLHLAGAHVREVVAYRTVCSETLDPASAAAAADADAILFFSPSAVHAFVDLVEHGVLAPIPDSTGIGAIGPVTKENLLKEARMRCDFEADEPSIEQIIAALVAFFEHSRASSAGAPSR
jgi:uroporphyrinogen-III synthase